MLRVASFETRRSSKHLHTFSHQHMYQSTWLSSAPDVNPYYLSETNHTEHCRQRKEICWKLKYEAAFLEFSKKHMNIKDHHYSKKSSFENTLLRQPLSSEEYSLPMPSHWDSCVRGLFFICTHMCCQPTICILKPISIQLASLPFPIVLFPCSWGKDMTGPEAYLKRVSKSLLKLRQQKEKNNGHWLKICSEEHLLKCIPGTMWDTLY